MFFLKVICEFLLFLNLLCFVLVMRKKLSKPILLGSFIVIFVISLLFPLRYVLCNPILKEQVSITVLREKNDASFGSDVVIQYIDSNYSERSLENPVEGKWAWWNGTYRWSDAWESQGLHPTDTIIMEAPVGYDRYIAFSTGPSYGKVEITCLENIQTVDLYNTVEGILPVKLPASLHDYIKDRVLRVVAFEGIEILIIASITFVSVVFSRKNMWRHLTKMKWEVYVFLLSVMNIIVMGRYPSIVDWSGSYYFINYERGFGTRGLIGALTTLIGGPYIEQEGLAVFILTILTLSYLIASILVVNQAKKESDWRIGAFWVLLYLFTPHIFIEIYDCARPDLYLILLFMIAIIMINKKYLIQLMPVVCVAMMLINETSCTFFIAPILALMLYICFREKNPEYFIAFISSAAFTCLLAIQTLFLDKGQLMSLDSYFAHMLLHTDLPLNRGVFITEYADSEYRIMNIAETYGNQVHQHYEALTTFLLYFILIIPLVLLFYILWKAVYKKMVAYHSEGSLSLLSTKFFFWILLLSSCGGAVCMLMAYDYPRYSAFIIIAMLAIVFTLINKEKLILQISDLYLFTPSTRDFPLAPFAVLIYMAFWGTLNSWTRETTLFENLAQIIRDFLGM